MYAIVQQGGHQYRVAPGDRLVVDQLDAPVGSMVALQPVLLVQDDGGATVGTPTLEGARVAAVVVGHRRGTKLRIFKYKPKKRFRRTRGYRSCLTELRIEALLAAGEPLPDIAEAVEKEVAEPPKGALEPKPAGGRRAARGRAAEPPADAAAVEQAIEESRAEDAEAEAAETVVPEPEPKAKRGPRAARARTTGETTTPAPPAAETEA